MRQSTDIAGPQGTQQQTHRMLLQQLIDGTEKQMDGHCTITTDHAVCYKGNANEPSRVFQWPLSRKTWVN